MLREKFKWRRENWNWIANTIVQEYKYREGIKGREEKEKMKK